MKIQVVLFLVFGFVCSATIGLFAQNTLTLDYSGGHIATSTPDFDASCNGPSATITFSLPAGENINVTGIDIYYIMTAVGANNPLDQRSAIFCQNTGIQESTQSTTTLVGNNGYYARTGVSIANGTYAGGTELTFEMRAWRTQGGAGCGTNEQFVQGSSWQLILHYGDPFLTPKIGANTNNPEAVFDVNGKLKIGDDNAPVVEGNVRYNESEKDFEGYDGSEWHSFTGENSRISGSDGAISEVDMDLIPNPNAAFGSFAMRQEFINEQGDIIISSNNQRIYLHKKIDEIWTLKDSLSIINNTIRSFMSGRVIIQHFFSGGNNIFYTYNIAGGNFILEKSETLTGALFITSATFKGNEAYIGIQGTPDEVRVYDTSTSPWVLKQTLVPPTTPVTFDRFGASIHQYRNRLYVGSTQEGTIGSSTLGAGVVYVYGNIGGSWQLLETITSPDIIDNWKFGIQISSWKNQIFIGSSPSTSSANAKIYIYEIGDNGHSLLQELATSISNESYGRSFAANHDYLVVGSNRTSDNTLRAYIYKNENSWTLLNEIEIPTPAIQQKSKVGISKSHVFFAISDFNTHSAHGIYVYTREDNNPIDFSEISNIPAGLLEVNDADSDPTNEIQTASKSGSTVTLSNGGGSFNVNDADSDPANEFQTITKSGTIVTLSDGGGSFDVKDADNLITNELQMLSKSGNMLTLSDGGGTVDISDTDADATNELVTNVTLVGNLLKIFESANEKTVSLSPIATPWSKNNNNIYFNNYIGIGKTTPLRPLDVEGTVQITRNSNSLNPHLNLVEDGADYARINMGNSSGNIIAIAANPNSNTDNSLLNFYFEGAGDVMSIKGNKRVGINDSSPDATLHVKHGIGSDKGLRLENAASDYWRMYVSSSSSNLQLYSESNTSIARGTFNYASGVYTSASDRRLKREIHDLHFSWDSFMQIKPTNYIFKSDKNNRQQLGLIAQDFLKIYPELVHYDEEDDSYKLDYSGTGVIAIKAIQALYEENVDLKKQNELLLSKLEALEGKVEDLFSSLEKL